MGKIIKYEWKKQRTSRTDHLFRTTYLPAGICFRYNFQKRYFCISQVTEFMLFCSFLVIFYTGIESLLVFNRDLRTKQIVTLWMIPKSTYEILGAKFLAAILQMLFVFTVFAAAG